jgi:hypothetical protein
MTDSSNGIVYVYTKKLESTFRKVRDIQDFVKTYALAPSGHKVSVDDIRWALEEKYGLQIRMELIDFNATHIRGMMERYENGQAFVFVKENQEADVKANPFWHRFIATKEMAHLAIDEKEDWNTDGTETIDGLIREHSNFQGRPPREGIQSEHLAEIAAIELLYPWIYRQADVDSGMPVTELSQIYQVPQYVIQRALDSDYMKMARATWNEINPTSKIQA